MKIRVSIKKKCKDATSKVRLISVCFVVLVAFREFLNTRTHVIRQRSLTSYINDSAISNDSPNAVKRTYNELLSCMLDLENHYFKREIQRCWDSGIPYPFSVKIHNDKYYILLTLSGIPSNDATNSRTDYMAYKRAKSYYCNGEAAEQQRMKKAGREFLTIECPTTLKASETKLELFSIELPEEEHIGPHQSRYVECNATPLLACEEVDRRLSSAIVQAENPKVGITATFGGEFLGEVGGDRQNLLEWITYHQLIGFDHIWLYVNEPWLNGTDLPTNLDGVTLIPFDNKIANHWDNFTFPGVLRDAHREVFRIGSQNDALWRAKRMNLDWMAFIDLDEIVVLENHTSYSSTPNVKKYLEIWNKTHGEAHSGIWMKSLPFGNNPDQPKPDPNYLLSSTWRQTGDPEEYIRPKERMKLLVKVNQVTAVKIHYIAGGRDALRFESNTDIRINHYKGRDRGVFNQGSGYYRHPDILEDTKLRDEMLDSVVRQMELNMQTSR